MFVSQIRAEVSLGPAVLPGDPRLSVERPRGVHARLLETAAARRRRAVERRASRRHEDADYWIQCAPVALAKAASIRGSGGFDPLP